MTGWLNAHGSVGTLNDAMARTSSVSLNRYVGGITATGNAGDTGSVMFPLSGDAPKSQNMSTISVELTKVNSGMVTGVDIYQGNKAIFEKRNLTEKKSFSLPLSSNNMSASTSQVGINIVLYVGFENENASMTIPSVSISLSWGQHSWIHLWYVQNIEDLNHSLRFRFQANIYNTGGSIEGCWGILVGRILLLVGPKDVCKVCFESLVPEMFATTIVRWSS